MLPDAILSILVSFVVFLSKMSISIKNKAEEVYNDFSVSLFYFRHTLIRLNKNLSTALKFDALVSILNAYILDILYIIVFVIILYMTVSSAIS